MFIATNPLWKIPIELKRLHPEIPIFVIQVICRDKSIFTKLLKSSFRHRWIDDRSTSTPENSLSDKNQQLTPNEFAQLIHSLNISTATNTQDTLLQQYREIIDELDKEICLILSKRFSSKNSKL